MNDTGTKVFTKADAAVLMSDAVCYALIALEDDKELKERTISILLDGRNEALAKTMWIQMIMHEVNKGLIDGYLKSIETLEVN